MTQGFSDRRSKLSRSGTAQEPTGSELMGGDCARYGQRQYVWQRGSEDHQPNDFRDACRVSRSRNGSPRCEDLRPLRRCDRAASAQLVATGRALSAINRRSQVRDLLSRSEFINKFIYLQEMMLKRIEGSNPALSAGQIVVLQQDPVLQGLMPSLDLALCLGMIGRTADVLHISIVEPIGQVSRDIARPVVGQQPRFVDDRHHDELSRGYRDRQIFVFLCRVERIVRVGTS